MYLKPLVTSKLLENILMRYQSGYLFTCCLLRCLCYHEVERERFRNGRLITSSEVCQLYAELRVLFWSLIDAGYLSRQSTTDKCDIAECLVPGEGGIYQLLVRPSGLNLF